jgi:hypothetical protein
MTDDQFIVAALLGNPAIASFRQSSMIIKHELESDH